MTRPLAVPLALVATVVLTAGARGQDFAELTSLAEGALSGDNVATAVPGFEIRILQDGEVLYHQAFGDWTIDRVASADSGTKTLSGAVMVSVAETAENGFSLDSRLADFLPAFDKTGYRDISIRQAFSHTSGLPGQEFGVPLTSDLITLQQSAALIAQQPLAPEPDGSVFAYGGLSMQAAGAAVEVATATPYASVMAERITTPLAMSDTQFVQASPSNPRVGGGMVSTATDYSRFMDMLLNDGVDRLTGTRVLQADSVEAMLAPQTGDVETIVNSPVDNANYGVGVWLDQLHQFGPGVDYLAAGARGFHSWIDAEHDLVFTLATDVTAFSNLEELSSMMHRAILTELILPGDYNDDGFVDAVDYTVWRDRFGAEPGALPNDIDGGVIGLAQYETWAANFGASASPVNVGGVPEPSGLGIAACLASAAWLFSSARSATTWAACK